MCQNPKEIESEKIKGMEYQYLSFFLILFTILLFLVLFISKNYKPRRKLPPGPPKLPLIGNLHLFIGTLPHHCLRDLAKKHGPLMHLQLGELSTIVISSPEVAQQIMKTHDINFANRPYSSVLSLMSYNCTDIAFAPYGDHWRQQKNLHAGTAEHEARAIIRGRQGGRGCGFYYTDFV